MNLSLAQLRATMPRLPAERAATYLPHLVAAMTEFGINTPARAAAFLAQAAHESSELLRLVENLNYSWQGLLDTWPTRFGRQRGATSAQRAAGEALARKLHRQPMAIANYVYANREGNGDVSSGDGWRYRGRGIFQLTLRNNYRRAASDLRLPLDEDPDLVAIDPAVACRTAGWFWRTNGLSLIVDAGAAVVDPAGPREAMVVATRRINGGLKGLEDRLAFWERAKRALAA